MARLAALVPGLFGFAALAACSSAPPDPPVGLRAPQLGDLWVTELASVNAGGGAAAARDEHGDYDDWIELYNATDHPLALSGLWFSDDLTEAKKYRLPADAGLVLPAKGYRLAFADDEVVQGPLHLPFGLDKKGEALVVSTDDAVLVSTEYPAMKAGESWARGADGAFSVCKTPTPGAENDCRDPNPPATEYAAYPWPSPWPAPLAGPVVVSELDPLGATGGVPWLELWNPSGSPVDLGTTGLYLTRVRPPEELPSAAAGDRIAASGVLAPDARIVVDAPGLSAEGGVLVVLGPGGEVWDRLAFEALQPGTILALPPDGRGLRIACDALGATPGAANGACVAPAARASAPAMLRTIASEADFDAMAGPLDETTSDAASVKFIVDREHGNTVYFVDSARWLLHFDWIWEVIDGNTPFDLCTPEGRSAHLAEWGRFSQANYFVVEGRRYYLGTVIHYRDSDLWTIEFAAGDRISPEQVKETFFLVAGQLFNGTRLFVRPTTARLEGAARQLEGQLPLLPANRPFEGETLQTLNPGIGYGVLQLVKAADLAEAPVSYQSIIVLDHIPIELPPVNGTITEEFQTPLSHVNVLAQNRGTPNMALKGASTDPRIAPLLGKLVRMEVTPTTFDLRVATATEAEAFWETRLGSHGVLVPPRDLSLREVVSLEGRSFEDVARIGAKAAQFAVLTNLDWPTWAGGATGPCALSGIDARLPMPRPAFAIPFSRYVDHLAHNGIDREIESLLTDEATLRDPVRRRDALQAIRDRIEAAPIDPELVSELTTLIRANYGTERVRLRSSTNVEDLAGFNGAGLYESHAVQLGTSSRDLEDALRKVWSSVWTFRGFDERTLFGVDQRAVAMGVLIHRGFPDEEANGVAITRNVVAPTSHGFYINAQVGEISVVQPEGGALPEQLLYKMYTPPEVVVLARSTATNGQPVLQNSELHRLACVLRAIHARFLDHYKDRIAADAFAADVEWKLAPPGRTLYIKQARPWTAGAPVEPGTCHP